MKKLVIISALAALIAGCGAAPGPKATVEKVINAFEAGDGKTIVECMSAADLEEFNATVEEMKANPEETAMMMGFLGITVTADEIGRLDTAGFMSLITGSELFKSEFTGMTVGAERIEGEEAYVEVSMGGETEEVMLVKERGRWVITGGFGVM